MPINYPQPTVALQGISTRVSEYMARSYPIRDVPLNVRPAMVFITAAWILLLGVLGMAPLPELPVNDKALHFFGMGFATFLVYFIIEVPETTSRRIWYIRRAPLILTLTTTFLVGGIMSEFVQSMLPWKTFQTGDILSNLLGSTLFLYLAHLLHQRHRRKSEISSLYQPLSSASYRDAQGREHLFSPSGSSPAQAQKSRPGRQGSNVWDDEDSDGEGRAGAFEIGDEEDMR
ncbi:uncharacterized protein MKK02DRAFT_38278 [Dioszegia hungarica]|uniref:VanZ-like domain-containing protein n=1 Tax=Dioszegia hungarica TaxID=4972 RepID=A0AA38H4H8_9TREE|nr:uncharacterized protein MKK02DRAFT_38278 [Dioszegia hungarica]KAI9633620.1 hypothetical protein MKK02DRAFT_38278 [Dioszegia hungarica]